MPSHDPTEALSNRMPMPVPVDYASRLNGDQLQWELDQTRRVLADHHCYDTGGDGDCPVCFNLRKRVVQLEAMLSPPPASTPCDSMCQVACQTAAQSGSSGPMTNEDLLNDRMAPEDFHDLAKTLMGQEGSAPVNDPSRWTSWKRVVSKVRVRLLRHFGQSQAGVSFDDIAVQDSPSMATVVFRTFSVRINASDFDQAGFNGIWRGEKASDRAECGMTNFIVERVLSAAENWKL